MVNLITDHIDIWTSAQTQKTNGAGRGNSSANHRQYGIKKLRELIYELAFSGRLCENSKENPNYKDILRSILKERKDFHNERNVRLQKFEPLQLDLDEPKLPSNWCYIYLNDVIIFITDFQANGSFATLKKNVQYFQTQNYAVLVRLKDLRHNLTREEDFVYTDKHGYDFLSKSFIEGGEIVVANVGAGVGTTLEIPRIDRPATLAPNMFMIVLSKYIDKDYFKYFCQSPYYWEHINRVNVGTGQPKINKKEYKSCKIPFPPIEEQHRIVAKVDELMALCDQLERKQTDSNVAHQTLVETLLATLNSAASQDEFIEAWHRITKHFDTLFATAQSIDQFKQTILQLAVMGKLGPQDPNDEPASVLLKKINDSLCNKIKIKSLPKLKRDKSTIDPKEFHCAIPENWIWCELQDISIFTNGKAHEQYVTKESRYILINSRFVSTSGVIIKYATKRLTPLEKGDIAIVMSDVPDGRALVRCFLVEQDEKYTLNQRIGCISSSTEMNKEYLKLVLDRNKYYLHYDDGQKQTNLKKIQIMSCPIPLPPLAEQHRIVAKVDELMARCDSLKARINDTQTTQIQLADAIVEQAVS